VHQPHMRVLDLTSGSITPAIVMLDAHKHLGAPPVQTRLRLRSACCCCWCGVQAEGGGACRSGKEWERIREGMKGMGAFLRTAGRAG
jgi:hypothetical protein